METDNSNGFFWTELAPAWKACFSESWKAYLDDCFPIGAAITDADGHILAQGRNAINTQQEHPAVSCHPLAHAELNALIHLNTNQVDDIHACTLWTLVEPCPLCMGALYMSGVRQVRYLARDPFAGSVNMLGATPYLSRKPIQSIGPGDANLEDMIVGLNIEAMVRLTSDICHPVFSAWKDTLPRAYDLGFRLIDQTTLQEMRRNNTTSQQAYQWVYKQLQSSRNEYEQ